MDYIRGYASNAPYASICAYDLCSSYLVSNSTIEPSVFFIEYSERHLLSVLEKERCSMAEKFALFKESSGRILEQSEHIQ